MAHLGEAVPAKDQDASVRAQAGWWPDKRPSGPGEYVEAEGSWVRHRDYGLQFQAQKLRATPGEDA